MSYGNDDKRDAVTILAQMADRLTQQLRDQDRLDRDHTALWDAYSKINKRLDKIAEKIGIDLEDDE